jgi:hypothetical protein
MKKIMSILISYICFAGLFSCKKNVQDPLTDYSTYGIFKEIYPLKDSITVDLKPGDSTFIETNKGKIGVYIKGIAVLCYKGSINNSCPDGGLNTVFYLRLNNEISNFSFLLDDFPKNSFQEQYPLKSCQLFLPPNEYGNTKTVGSMNIQLRNVYPNPTSKTEYDKLIQTNGFHTTLTFQKICR